MKTMKSFVILFIAVILLFSMGARASLFNRKDSEGNLIIKNLEGAGLPKSALDLIFRMFDYNTGRIANNQLAVLVDYSRPSTQKRLHVLDLRSGAVQSYFVGHSGESGVLWARNFSNNEGSFKNSLGFAYARGFQKHPQKEVVIPMDGIDKSNDLMRTKGFVIYGSTLMGDAFVNKHKRMAWSDGGVVLSLTDFMELSDILSRGTLILFYHSDLMGFAKRFPKEQGVIGSEVVPPGVTTQRMAGENPRP